MARHSEQGQKLCERHQLTDNDRSATSCPAERLERFHVCEGQRATVLQLPAVARPAAAKEPVKREVREPWPLA